MDAFKLLTRGTSLAKSRPARTQGPEKRVPSEGDSERSQVLSEHHEAELPDGIPGGSESNGRGNKRKRDSNSSPNLQDKKQQAPDPQFQLKTEDECKRLLKLHKLKVSVLNDLPSQSKAQSKGQKHFTQLISQPLESFRDLGPWFEASRRLTENVASQGYVAPTEVQLGSIPLLLGSDEDRGLIGLRKKATSEKSHVDLLTVAPTGSGKTLAFLIPLIQELLDGRHKPPSKTESSAEQRYVKALILAPTHELVEQTVNEARKLLPGTGLKVSAMHKGVKIFQPSSSDEETQEGADAYVKSDILVSTPLVLLKSLSTASTSKVHELSSISDLVLDEADVLLDPLFREQTLAIWTACTNPLLHVSLWSATIGASIETLTKSFILDRRERLGLPSDDHFILRLIVGLKDSALPTISHRMVYTATEQGKLLAMRQMLHPSTAEPSGNIPALRPPFLVFAQTIQRASALHSELLYDIPAEAGGSSRIAVLHSQLSDTARSDIMARFRKAEIWVLITTDLLARGIDFRGVNGVVNYDIPNTSAAYVHRAGRTGRAGREGGVSVTLYTKEDIPYVRNIANVIAASEKQHGRGGSESAMPDWLLDALPTVSKKTKQEFKRKGVAARRPDADLSEDRQARRMRISTKSGYDRKIENKRKATQDRRAPSKTANRDTEDGDRSNEGEWGGFED